MALKIVTGGTAGAANGTLVASGNKLTITTLNTAIDAHFRCDDDTYSADTTFTMPANVQVSFDGGSTWKGQADSPYSYGSDVGDLNIAVKVRQTASVGTGTYYITTNGTFSNATALSDVSGFTVAAGSSIGSIDVSWSATTNRTYYKLERSPDNTTWTTLSSTLTATSYADSDLTAGTYYYRIKAVGTNRYKDSANYATGNVAAKNYASASVTATNKVTATTFADGTIGTNLETSTDGTSTADVTTGVVTLTSANTTGRYAFIRTTRSIPYASPLPRYYVRVDIKHGNANNIIGNVFRLLQSSTKWTADTIANYDALTPCFAEFKGGVYSGFQAGWQGTSAGTFQNPAVWTGDNSATNTRCVVYEWCDGSNVYVCIRKQSDNSLLADASWSASSPYKPNTSDPFWFTFGDGGTNWGYGVSEFRGITVCADTRVTISGLKSGSGQKVKIFNSADSAEIGTTTGTESSGSTQVELFPTSSSTAPLDFTSSGQDVNVRIYDSNGTTLRRTLSVSNVYPGDTITVL